MIRAILHDLHTGYIAWNPEPAFEELMYVGEEWALPEYQVYTHHHPQYEFHLQLTGATEWTVNGEIVQVGKSSLIAVAPGHSHSFRATERQSHHFIYCAFSPEPLFARLGREVPWKEAPYFLIEDGEAFIAPFSMLSYEVVHQQVLREELVGEALRSIAYLLERHHRPGPLPAKTLHPSFMTDVARKIEAYVDRHLNERLSIEDMARSVGLSRSHLFEVMKRDLGTTPAAFQLQRRIERAKAMLQMKTLTLTSIAHDLGFSSSQHFSSAFKKITGQTPTSHRKH